MITESQNYPAPQKAGKTPGQLSQVQDALSYLSSHVGEYDERLESLLNDIAPILAGTPPKTAEAYEDVAECTLASDIRALARRLSNNNDLLTDILQRIEL